MPSVLSRGRNIKVMMEIDWDFKIIQKNSGYSLRLRIWIRKPHCCQIFHILRVLWDHVLNWGKHCIGDLNPSLYRLTKQYQCDHRAKVLPEWTWFKGVYLAELHTNKRERESRYNDFPAVRSSTELQNDYLPKAEHMNTTELLVFLHSVTKPNDPSVLLLYTVIFPINSMNLFLLTP